MNNELFDELMNSLHDAKAHDQGEQQLKTLEVKYEPQVISADEILKIRRSLDVSQAVFASLIKTSKRTYEKWEQGKAKPNEQAITLLKLIQQKPSIINDIAML